MNSHYRSTLCSEMDPPGSPIPKSPRTPSLLSSSKEFVRTLNQHHLMDEVEHLDATRLHSVLPSVHSDLSSPPTDDRQLTLEYELMSLQSPMQGMPYYLMPDASYSEDVTPVSSPSTSYVIRTEQRLDRKMQRTTSKRRAKMNPEQSKFIKEEIRKAVIEQQNSQWELERQRLNLDKQSLMTKIATLELQTEKLQHEIRYGRCYTTTPMTPSMWIWFDTNNLRTIDEATLTNEMTKHGLIKDLAANIENAIKMELVNRKQCQDAFENKRMY